MSENESLYDATKNKIKHESSETINLLIDTFFEFVKEKIKEIDWNKQFTKKDKDELLNLWSNQLVDKGMIPKGYAWIPDKLLIDNIHQEGYLDGMYVGYILAMMSLVDNNASADLICSVRDDVRQNLVGHHYNDREEFIKQFKDEKYSSINELKK